MTKINLEVLGTLKLGVLDKELEYYQSVDEPLFLAKTIAEWIDYSKTSKGAYDVSNMLKTVDEDEKLVRKTLVSGQNREMLFLTEDGVFEVLFQSHMPIAKQLKKDIKAALKEIRVTGVYIEDTATSDQKAYNFKMLDETFKRTGAEFFMDEYKACVDFHVKAGTRLNYERSHKGRRSNKKLSVAESKLKIMNRVLKIAQEREKQYRMDFKWELKSLMSDVVKSIALDIKEVKHNQTRGKLAQAKKAI